MESGKKNRKKTDRFIEYQGYLWRVIRIENDQVTLQSPHKVLAFKKEKEEILVNINKIKWVNF